MVATPFLIIQIGTSQCYLTRVVSVGFEPTISFNLLSGGRIANYAIKTMCDQAGDKPCCHFYSRSSEEFLGQICPTGVYIRMNR